MKKMRPLLLTENRLYLCTMKTMGRMMKSGKMFFALLAAIMLQSVPMHAQEMTRTTVDFFNCDSSIVRQYNKDTTLLYNKTKETSSFMVVTEGVTNCQAIYMEPLFMNDFEVKNKMVYFCGYIIENDVKRAVLGYFGLKNLTSQNVFYFVVADCTELYRLDMFKLNEKEIPDVNVVATGTTTGARSDALVEMKLFATTSPFNYSIYISPFEEENIDDVAVIKNRVVVSTRNVEDDAPVVNFWQFIRPTVSGMSIFNYTFDRKRITSPIAKSPVYLEHSTADSYSAVFRNRNYPRITTLKADITSGTPMPSVDVGGLNDEVTPQDIKWNAKGDVYDVLTFGHEDQEFRMHIYHFLPSVFTGASTSGPGTMYSYVNLWSIDPCPYPSKYFMVSGDLGNQPRLSSYSYSASEGCSVDFLYYCENGNLKNKLLDAYVPRITLDNLPIQRKEPRKVEIPFPYVCSKE